MWKWGKGNNESGLRRRKSWNGNRQWQVGRGERAKHWVGDSRWPMTWTDKPTSSTSTLPTSFFLHWRKSRQRLFWEIQIANIEITFVRTTTITTNICERLYLACIWWYILTISTFDIELARVSCWKIKTDWITNVGVACQLSTKEKRVGVVTYWGSEEWESGAKTTIIWTQRGRYTTTRALGGDYVIVLGEKTTILMILEVILITILVIMEIM